MMLSQMIGTVPGMTKNIYLHRAPDFPAPLLADQFLTTSFSNRIISLFRRSITNLTMNWKRYFCCTMKTKRKRSFQSEAFVYQCVVFDISRRHV